MNKYIGEDEREDCRREANEENWERKHNADQIAMYCPNDLCAEVEYDEDHPKQITERNG